MACYLAILVIHSDATPSKCLSSRVRGRSVTSVLMMVMSDKRNSVTPEAVGRVRNVHLRELPELETKRRGKNAPPTFALSPTARSFALRWLEQVDRAAASEPCRTQTLGDLDKGSLAVAAPCVLLFTSPGAPPQREGQVAVFKVASSRMKLHS
jgi:hypothetical protein